MEKNYVKIGLNEYLEMRDNLTYLQKKLNRSNSEYDKLLELREKEISKKNKEILDLCKVIYYVECKSIYLYPVKGPKKIYDWCDEEIKKIDESLELDYDMILKVAQECYEKEVKENE